MGLLSFLSSIGFCIFLFFGIYTLSKAPKALFNRVCFLGTMIFALWSLYGVFSFGHNFPVQLVEIAYRITILSLFIFPSFFLHFSLVTTENPLGKKPVILSILYAVPTLFTLFHNLFFFKGMRMDGLGYMPIVEMSFLWELGIFGANVLMWAGSIVILLVWVKQEKNSIAQKTAIWGALILSLSLVAKIVSEVLYMTGAANIKRFNVLTVLIFGIIIAITARRIVAHFIKHDDTTYHVIEQIHDMILIMDNRERIIQVNPTATQVLGYTLADLTELKLDKIIVNTPDFDYAKIKECYQSPCDISLLAKDGTVIPTELTLSPFYNRYREAIGYIAVVKDLRIFIKLQEENNLHKEAEEKFKKTFESSPTMMLITTLEGFFIIDANKAVEKALHLSRHEIIGHGLSELGIQIDHQSAFEIGRRLKTEGRIENLECTFSRNNGKKHIALYSAEVVNILGNKCLLNSVHDITEHISLRSQIKESEERFKEIFNLAPFAICLLDLEGNMIECNKMKATIFGYSENEIAHKNVFDMVYPEDRERVRQMITNAIQGEVLNRVEYRAIRKDGFLFDCECSVSVLRDNEANPKSILAIGKDVSEQKELENKLRDSTSNLLALINNTADNIWSLDKKYVLITINRNAKTNFKILYGVELQEGMDVSVYMPEPELKYWKILYENAFKGENVINEREFHFANQRVTLEISIHPIYGEDKRIIGAATFARNITQRKKMEEELVNWNKILEERVQKAVKESENKTNMLLMQSRQATIGEMIGNIAHQWRQPLNSLGLLSQNLRLRFERNLLDKDYVDNSVDKTVHLVNYMAQTIDDFRNFFRPLKDKHWYSIANTVLYAISIVEISLKDHLIEIDSSKVVHSDDMVSFGYQNEFAQVIINLLNNSKDALIETKAKHPKINIEVYKDGNKPVIVITDNGGGIDHKIMDKIFEPYFTTKPTGTGLGLYMVKTIVEQHLNGSLSVRNIDSGVEFVITMPDESDSMASFI